MQIKVSKDSAFRPVKVELTLETQAEVNALYAIACFSESVVSALHKQTCDAGVVGDLPVSSVLHDMFTPLKKCISRE